MIGTESAISDLKVGWNIRRRLYRTYKIDDSKGKKLVAGYLIERRISIKSICLLHGTEAPISS